MRWWVLLLALPLTAQSLHVTLTGEILPSLRLIQSSLAPMGYYWAVSEVNTTTSPYTLHGELIGKNPFKLPAWLIQLKLQKMTPIAPRYNASTIEITLDTTMGVWNIAPLDGDAQLPKMSSSAYFRLPSTVRSVHFEPPYMGSWYPDVTLFDGHMIPIYTLRSTQPHEGTLLLNLPDHAAYIKISNTYGMGILPEGMWLQGIH